MRKKKVRAIAINSFALLVLLGTAYHLFAEIPLQPPETAVTLYWKNGKVATTNGPCTETKEQLGGLTILDCFESKILQDPQSNSG